jgi:hypothetical protein
MAGLSLLELSVWTVTISIGACEMKMAMPKTISAWCMWLFFLFVGLGMFVPILATLAPWLALAYAILAFIGM